MSGATEITIGPEAIVASSLRNTCGESPFWSAPDQAFFWADIPAGRIHRWRPAEEVDANWQLPEQVGCIARQRDGGILAACERHIYSVVLGESEAQLTQRANIEHPAPNMRFNDGRCDRQGRLWVTSFVMSGDKQPVGALFRYTPEGLSGPLMTGFMTPNGMAFSPDNRTLYIADSHASVRKIWAVAFDLEHGVIGERRLFVDMAGSAARPDGAAIDVDGCYWVAGMDAACILRFTPQGVLDRIVRLPVRHPTMCSFGGRDMKEMFVTSLRRPNVAAEEDPWAGSVLRFDPHAQGIAEVAFNG